MSKARKGPDCQDAVIARFRKDAKGSIAGSAVTQFMRKTPETARPEPVRMSFRFLATGE